MSSRPSMPPTRPPRGPLHRLARAFLLLTVILVIFGWSGCMERLFYYPIAEATPAPTAQFPRAEAVTFASADGTTLCGWFIPAEGVASTAAPTILHAHGNAGNMTSHIWFTEYLPAAGMNLLLFDYRGYGESEGTASKRNGLIADTEAALDYLLKRDDIDVHRIGLYGQSLGGSIALNVMARRPELKAAVIESAFASWRDAAASALGGGEPGWLARLAATVLIRDHARPIDAIAEIDRPLLFLHGTSDSIIPVQHSRRMVEASQSGKLIEYPGGDHNTLREQFPEMQQHVIDFFRKHLRDGDD